MFPSKKDGFYFDHVRETKQKFFLAVSISMPLLCLDISIVYCIVFVSTPQQAPELPHRDTYEYHRYQIITMKQVSIYARYALACLMDNTSLVASRSSGRC